MHKAEPEKEFLFDWLLISYEFQFLEEGDH